MAARLADGDIRRFRFRKADVVAPDIEGARIDPIAAEAAPVKIAGVEGGPDQFSIGDIDIRQTAIHETAVLEFGIAAIRLRRPSGHEMRRRPGWCRSDGMIPWHTL